MKVLIFICLFLGYLFIKMKKNILILQQNFYNENGRYLKWGIKNILKAFNIFEIVICLFNLCILIVKYEWMAWVNILYLGLIIISVIKKEKFKLPLKITNRVKRIFVTGGIIYILPLIIFNGNRYLMYFIYNLTIVFNFLVVFLVNVINMPIEKLVYCNYRRNALKKLRKNKEIVVIGITGSYGKTSCKNILNEVLSIKYKVLMTPKNYNTPYGLIITINNYMDKFDEVFIAEMGAFRVGSINRLCKLVHPQYGIITNIGLAHLESFGSIENIQKGKFELIEALPNDGVAILNKDDFRQRNYKIKNTCKVIWIGIDEVDVDVRAINIKLDSEGTNFKVIFKGDNKQYYFYTRLLGKVNVYNILSSIALGKYLGMSIADLQLGVKKVKTIPHRLEIKKLNEIVIIDDAYNSNPVGANMAIDVLKLLPGLKIVVTPGMIELGEMEDDLNKKFGKYMSKVANYVILIGKKQTKAIYDGLLEENYNEEKIYVINDTKDAFKIINKIQYNGIKYVLFENDLPDIFNEK